MFSSCAVLTGRSSPSRKFCELGRCFPIFWSSTTIRSDDVCKAESGAVCSIEQALTALADYIDFFSRGVFLCFVQRHMINSMFNFGEGNVVIVGRSYG